MEFCPECGNLMNPDERDGKVYLVCSSCGHEELQDEEEENDSYKMVEESEEKEETAVVEEDMENKPKTNKKCPECGHDKAYWWMQQTRSADEPSTRFYRCVECGHTWREY